MRITLFCLEKRLSKHKMTMFSKNLGSAMAPLAPPGYVYVQTRFWQNQARSQVLRFGESKYIFRGKDFCFYHMFETNSSDHNKI